MYKILLILLLFFSGCTVDNTPHMKQLIDQAKEQESKEGVIHKDILYKSTLLFDLKLDIYEPLIHSETPSPVYFYIHGGSWLRGDKDLVNLYNKTMHSLRQAGVTVVSIDYRFVSQAGIAAMVSDCFDAITYIQEHAQQYHLDPHHIGLHGHSAGANLALVTGFTLSKKSHDIMFIVDEYGPTDAVKLIREQDNAPWWSQFISDASLDKISPLRMVHLNIPPVYIAHGDADKTVPIAQSYALFKKLQKEGIPSSMHVVKGADHSYRGASDAVIQKHRAEVKTFMLKQYAKIKRPNKSKI